MRQNRVHVRLLLIAGVALLWTTLVFGRLSYLQLFAHGEYMARAQRQQQRTIEITPKRGIIYDRNMHALAMSVPVKSAFAVPAEIADESLAARLLSGVLGVPQDVLEARMASSRSFVWISRKLPPEKVEASKSEKIMVMADARQRWFDGGEAQRERGANVVLTLDEKIQYIVQRELLAAIEKTHALAGSVIVMNPNTGEILAMSNWPRFNPNAASEAPAESRMNRAVTALYEPGSTFKLITLAAAFDQEITRADEVFDCENGAIYIAGHRIRDHKPFGLLSVSEILAKSSDVGAIKIALRLGAPRFYDYIRGFGFGAPTGIDLPGEGKGLLHRLENWSAISIGSVSMGQEIGVTPIQLITAVSAIANGGTLVKPHVVQAIKRGERVVGPDMVNAHGETKRVIRPETAATLRRLMEGVVLNGTGPLARLDGWTAAGKTGTAQKIDPATGRYSPTQLIASFTGFAPISNPAVTILVSLDSPVGLHEGGQVAAPVFKRIAEQVLSYLDVPRDVPLNPRLIQAAYKRQMASESAMLEDFSPTDFSGQPDAPPAASNPEAPDKPAAHAPEVAMAADEGGDISVPDFSGKTMREVTEMCLHLGLEPLLVGSNLATQQIPEAGAQVRRGAKVTVQFGTPLPAKPVKVARFHRRSRH